MKMNELVNESNVTDIDAFRKRKEREKRIEALDDIVTSVGQSFDLQAAYEKQTKERIYNTYSNGNIMKKKYYLPFVMKHYKSDTSPLQTLLWLIDDIVGHRVDDDYTKEQLNFAYDLFVNNRESIEQDIEEDLARMRQLKAEILQATNIPLPDFIERMFAPIEHEYNSMLYTVRNFDRYAPINPEQRMY